MAYNIFKRYHLDNIRDSLNESFDSFVGVDWKLIDQKEVPDADGFLTEYSWYSNGDLHIFMFGDSELYPPDPAYADWEADSQEAAQEWFDNYHGFEEDSFEDYELESYDEYQGNRNFINDAFDRLYMSPDNTEKEVILENDDIQEEAENEIEPSIEEMKTLFRTITTKNDFSSR